MVRVIGVWLLPCNLVKRTSEKHTCVLARKPKLFPEVTLVAGNHFGQRDWTYMLDWKSTQLFSLLLRLLQRPYQCPEIKLGPYSDLPVSLLLLLATSDPWKCERGFLFLYFLIF